MDKTKVAASLMAQLSGNNANAEVPRDLTPPLLHPGVPMERLEGMPVQTCYNSIIPQAAAQ